MHLSLVNLNLFRKLLESRAIITLFIAHLVAFLYFILTFMRIAKSNGRMKKCLYLLQNSNIFHMRLNVPCNEGKS